jgi:hypothetical protein
MPSPFPGMNPYLEQSDTWEDFHQNFMTRAQEVLSPQVGANYLVKIETRLYLRELAAEERRFVGRADVAVTDTPPGESTPGVGAAVVTAPLDLYLPAVDTQRESYLEIHDRRERRVVTVVELLSPANKTPGADHAAYLGKRRSLLASQTHLVEIDLRRGGVRPQPPELPPCDYYVLVSRYQQRPRVGVWPIGLRDRLPVIPVPLTPPDPDVSLDLQELLHRIYDAAGYAKYIYDEEPHPPLLPADAVWARQFVPRRTGGQTEE